MAGEEQIRPLGDLVELVRGTTYKSALLGKPGPVLLGLATIERNGGFRSDSLRTYGGDSPDRLILQPGDLYVSLKDVTQSADLLGAIARVPADVTAGRLTQDTVKLELKRGANADLIYWSLRTPEYREYCRSYATGTTNLGLARTDFLAFGIPPLSAERRVILNLLGALDAKIDANSQMVITLEEMARALFKSWFVDFDPVRAKAEGRDTGLSADIAALFSNSFDEEGLPEGWSQSTIGELFTVVAGNTPSTKQANYWGGPNAWATPKDMSGLPGPLLMRTERSLSEEGFKACSSGEIPPMSLLMSSRAPVGYLAFNTLPVSINQGIAAFVANKLSPYYAWAWCHENMELIKANANGSTFQEISKGVLRTIAMTEPSTAVHDAFVAIMETTFSRIGELAKETASIISLRDELLPKLLSGELRVNDAADSIAAA